MDTDTGKITFTLHDKRIFLAAHGKRFFDIRHFPHIDSIWLICANMGL